MPKMLEILFGGGFLVVYLPIFLQRRRIAEMSDADLKRLDYDEWRSQTKSHLFIKMSVRAVGGSIILAGFIINFQKFMSVSFKWLTVLFAIFGI